MHLRTKADVPLQNGSIFVHISKSRTADAVHLSELANDAPELSKLTPLGKPALDESFRKVLPFLLQPKEFNDKIQGALTKFITLLGEKTFASALDSFVSRVVALGGVVSTEEVPVPTTQLSTYRLITDGLSADQVRQPSVSNPLRSFEYLRCVIEDVVRIQSEQMSELQRCLALLRSFVTQESGAGTAARRSVKEKKADAAVEERIRLVTTALEDNRKTTVVVRDMMQLTHQKFSAHSVGTRASVTV